MNNEDTKEIFGSYEKSLSDSKTITGHNNTVYMVGGNARYNLKSNIDEWGLAANSGIDNQIKIINQILNISPQITDSDELSIFLQELIKLKQDEFVKFMEKSMNLYEPIQIQLRKLFYAILDKFTDDGKNDKYHIGFCKFEPITRINALLNMLDKADLETPILVEQFQKIADAVAAIEILSESKRMNINFTIGGAIIDSAVDLKPLMDRIVELHGPLFPVLNAIEKKNILIAENINIISIALKTI